MDQVKKDLDANEDLRKAMNEIEEMRGSEAVERLRRKRQTLLQSVDVLRNCCHTVVRSLARKTELIKNTFNGIGETSGILRAVGRLTVSGWQKLGGVVGVLIDSSSTLLESLDDEGMSARKRAEVWRQTIHGHSKNSDSGNPKNSDSGNPKNSDCASVNGKVSFRNSSESLYNLDTQDNADAVPPEDFLPPEIDEPTKVEKSAASEHFALVISHQSAWDRFGSRLRDMPFLHEFFENPVVEHFFGETEQAVAVRQMKYHDPKFRLNELTHTVRHVIAPHIVKCYLVANDAALHAQCGEAAYAALSQSIRERNISKVALDPTILLLRNVELRGAKRGEDEEAPWFIYSFSTQQINCLRDMTGRVVSGAIDDVREVVYIMAVSLHPEPTTPGLHHPWMVKELAVVGNTPSW
eukprot:CAMPEP_0113845964 /NCGR_PEP_ID=MMETSP0372-20130328/1043_1 /TAXON_ID=340204 /ORGANISM="Lankesteria abbotti" /LENGTH=408 /DNA_ID=CAMNT_0000815053 /DNA_START=384 /DNA_END=1610 /DNA_ORIENTATION=+ /assembly_acc=CAM_ASM_000359